MDEATAGKSKLAIILSIIALVLSLAAIAVAMQASSKATETLNTVIGEEGDSGAGQDSGADPGPEPAGAL